MPAAELKFITKTMQINASFIFEKILPKNIKYRGNSERSSKNKGISSFPL